MNFFIKCLQNRLLLLKPFYNFYCAFENCVPQNGLFFVFGEKPSWTIATFFQFFWLAMATLNVAV